MPNTYNKKGKMQEDVNQNIDEINEDNLDQELLNEEESPFDENAQQEFSEEGCPLCQAIKKENAEMNIRYLAEMDNFKKRMQREKEENAKYAAENILQDIIPALDNLDLALQYANNDACKDIVMGIQMTRKLLLDSLKNHGLEQINAEKVEFDPNIHEAVGQEESDEVAPQYVIRTLQKGYTLKERLLRPAKVIVSK